MVSTVGKVAIGWAIVVTTGLSAFFLSKKSIDRQRIENMQARERMRKANYGEYPESYRKFNG